MLITVLKTIIVLIVVVRCLSDVAIFGLGILHMIGVMLLSSKKNYNRENETCNFLKRNEQNFSFLDSFFLRFVRLLKHQLNAD